MRKISKKGNRCNLVTFSAMIGIVCICAACAAPKVPLYRSTQWNPASVQNIAVLPVLDARLDRTEEINIERFILKPAAKKIRGRGYQSGTLSTWGAFPINHIEQVKRITPEQVRQLGPQTIQYVFLVALMDVKSEMGFGSSGNAEVAAWLFDKQTGTAVWYDKGIGQYGQGGLAGMMVKGLMGEAAVESAMSDLFRAFPSRSGS